MAIQKNFVIKNGLEVNDNLIFADAVNNQVGINTSVIQYELDVNGDIGASTVYTDDLILNGGLGIGNSFGAEGSYLISTGTGVTWSSTSSSRITQTYTATEGQTTFSFTYNPSVGIDVFVNGVRLSPSSYIATDGISVILSVGCFDGDNVDLVAYSVTGIGAGITGITGITVLNEGVSIGNDSNITSLNFVGSGVTASLAGFGATVTVPSYWIETAVGIHTLSNVGIGTTNPQYKLDVEETTRIKGFIETQNTSTISNNILSLNATQGTVFTHTTSANIGIVSFTGISTDRASTQTFTVLVTQGAVGYNTTAATGIGTQLATIVTDTNVAISTHIKVGSGTTIILTDSAGALDVLTFVVSYNGVGIASTNFTIIGFAATDFRGVI